MPIALALIFLLLFSSFHSLRLAALIYLAVPMAATGGIFALAGRDLPFSISAGVGFIALFGVAVLNGLVWVSRGGATAARRGRTSRSRPRSRRRPAPADLDDRPGRRLSASSRWRLPPPQREIQRPLATVVIGGLPTSTLLTTLVLPAIYPWFVEKKPASDLYNVSPQFMGHQNI